MRPPLKWAGGKRRLLDEILPRLPKATRGTYWEPFVGGGAVFFALAAEGRLEGASRVVLGDTNKALINFYRVLRDDYRELVQDLEAYAGKWTNDAEAYYRVRQQYNDTGLYGLAIAGFRLQAARFLWLNRHCFNGLWRVNRKGQFNVPFGKYKAPKIDYANLAECSEALQCADLLWASFAMQIPEAEDPHGDPIVAYFDPPYWPRSKTASFTSYSAPFGPDDQRRLANYARKLPPRVTWLLSNSDVPETRELYAGLQIEQVFCGRGINSKASARGKVPELLVSR